MIHIPVVYIAGPFRAPNAWLREQNIREAEELAFRVAEQGAMPLCPHTNTRHFDGTLSEQFWLDGTLALLTKCDAIALTARWLESTGARAERDWASLNGLVVFRESDIRCGGFWKWVEQWMRERNR